MLSDEMGSDISCVGWLIFSGLEWYWQEAFQVAALVATRLAHQS